MICIHTNSSITKLSTGDVSVSVIPKVITNCSPTIVEAHLNTTFQIISATHQPECSELTDTVHYIKKQTITCNSNKIIFNADISDNSSLKRLIVSLPNIRLTNKITYSGRIITVGHRPFTVQNTVMAVYKHVWTDKRAGQLWSI